jgi:hypothetical protein
VHCCVLVAANHGSPQSIDCSAATHVGGANDLERKPMAPMRRACAAKRASSMLDINARLRLLSDTQQPWLAKPVMPMRLRGWLQAPHSGWA